MTTPTAAPTAEGPPLIDAKGSNPKKDPDRNGTRQPQRAHLGLVVEDDPRDEGEWQTAKTKQHVDGWGRNRRVPLAPNGRGHASRTRLGLKVANFTIGVDPQGLEGQGDNSHCPPAPSASPSAAASGIRSMSVVLVKTWPKFVVDNLWKVEVICPILLALTGFRRFADSRSCLVPITIREELYKGGSLKIGRSAVRPRPQYLQLRVCGG
jgi:hypothetical protein